jgi:outer membrane protein assembly factor BamB
MRGLGLSIAALLACLGSAAAAQSDIPINGSRVFPESITADAAGNIYVGSTGGTIYRAAAGTKSAEPWVTPGPDNGLTSLFGVLADDSRGLLWVCNNPPFGGPPQPGAKSALKAFDLATGALKASYDLPGEGPFACNDIAVGQLGTTFVTETAGGRIFALAPDGKALTLFARDAELVGIDGIAFAQDGTMYVNNVRRNTLLRVNRNGYDFASLTVLTLSQPINGPDGLRPVSGNRFLQAEGPAGRVTYVEISGDTATIIPVKSGLESSPGVTRIGNIGYATEGKISYLFDPALRDKSPDPFIIRAFPLP